ncbi:cobalt-precorrin-6A reductase [Methylobacterium sp. Leaf456]|uniref:cobalt-precorrin-6A reductase n=1 Tax=Methylobacterium sp. Leaf456 TaxID=1736382 RepID=UPI0009E98B7F|nr:cobalt-precorrin-6A reductase [Methylobacterium sp. Leaf456]
MTNAAGQGWTGDATPRPPKILIPKILILGGTTEASALAKKLAGRPEIDVVLSLAGRTAAPRPEPVATRIGGFGGAEGLARWIAGNGITAVIDATHPFAARISANAASACRVGAVPLLAIRRPCWARQTGDDWIEVESVAACVPALGEVPKTVFLTIGRQELSVFAAAPQHAYLVRTIEPVGDALPVPRLTELRARGPFTLEDEMRLMREAGITVLVTKNSGGAATYPKIEAARRLGLPVVIAQPPVLPDVASVSDAEGAAEWLVEHVAGRARFPSRQGGGERVVSANTLSASAEPGPSRR